MRQISKKWMEASVRYAETTEDGKEKTSTGKYVVDALTYEEAEQKVLCLIPTGGEITSMSRPAFGDVLFTDVISDDKYYTVKLCFISINEETGKEKKSTVTYLVQASSLNDAVRNIDTAMKPTTLDYVSVSASETKIIYVYEG